MELTLKHLKPLPHVLSLISKCCQSLEAAEKIRTVNPAKWYDILNEYYKEEIERRQGILDLCNKSTEARQSALSLISKREHLIEFMVDWCWTYDPRNAPMRLPTILPWIPWPRQVEYLDWLIDRYMNQESGLVEKSRDAGATWLSALFLLHEWRWTPGFAGGIGSNKLENVDKKDNPKSIFAKMRQLMGYLPAWWMPKGWEPKRHDKVANLVNPENGSNIAGEGGEDIGRGDRRAIYLVDEAASLEQPQSVDAALSQTTNCQIDLSTPKGMDSFAQKRFSGRVPVFTFNWRDDPRKGDAWYQRQVATLDAVIVAQEIDIDYHASVEGLFIPPAHVRAAIELDIPAVGIIAAGGDVAAGGKNRSALAVRKGPRIKIKKYHIGNGVDLVGTWAEVCNKIGVSYLNYDRIGVGYAFQSVIERTPQVLAFKHFGLGAGDTASSNEYQEFGMRKGFEVFFNAKAEWWYLTAKRFEKTYEYVEYLKSNGASGCLHPTDELISIDNDAQLIAELSSPKRQYTPQGKIKVESKEDLLKRGIESPDSADALVLAFIPQDAGMYHAIPGYDGRKSEGSNFRLFKLNWDPFNVPKQTCLHYGCMSLTPDLTLHVMGAIWDNYHGKLFIYLEREYKELHAEKIVIELIRAMHLNEFHFERFMANKEMLSEGRKSMVRVFNDEFIRLIRKQRIRLHESYRYNMFGSLALAADLALHRNLIVHHDCPHTNELISQWRIDKGKTKAVGQQENLLIILAELAQKIDIKAKILPVYAPTYKKDMERGPVPTATGGGMYG